MRLTSLVCSTFAVCFTPFAAAQSADDDLRAEIRRIVREEVRAALKDLHAGAVVATPTTQIVKVGGMPLETHKVVDSVSMDVAVTKGILGDPVAQRKEAKTGFFGARAKDSKAVVIKVDEGASMECCEAAAPKEAKSGECCEAGAAKATEATPCCEASEGATKAPAAASCCEGTVSIEVCPAGEQVLIVAEPVKEAKAKRKAKADQKKAKQAKQKAGQSSN